MSIILVLAEHEDGVFKKTAFELLGKASNLSAELNATVMAVVVGSASGESLGAYGADTVYMIPVSEEGYGSDAMVAGISRVIDEINPEVILASASYAGKEVLPRLAAKYDSGQASECTDLFVSNGTLVGTRPMYAGKCYADVTIQGTPAIFTVRPNSFTTPPPSSDTAKVVIIADGTTANRVTRISQQVATGATADLTEAEHIISGGRSLKSKEEFDQVIRPLASAIGASVGASRAAVDAGYAQHSEQVGQTGKTVNPSLYIACGISGAIQHLAGMRTSKVIVAINKDPEAPIFDHATYGIVGDLFEVCPALQRELEALSS